MNTSTTKAREPRNPWSVVVGGGLASAFATPIMVATIGLFILPISKEMGFDRATVTGAFSVAAIGMAIGMVAVGKLLDVYSVRAVLVPSFIGFGVCVCLIGLTPPIVAVFLAPYFFVGVFSAGTAIPTSKALVSWFDNKRGLVLGILSGISALGTALMPLLAGFLISQLGWRAAYGVLGVIALVVGVTMVLTFVRSRGERSVRGKLILEARDGFDEVSIELPGLTLAQAVRRRHFWLIIIGIGSAGCAIVGLQVNLVPIVTARGLDLNQATVLLTVWGLSGMIGRVIGGILLDRIHASLVGAIVIVAPALGILFLHPPFSSAAIAVAFMGIALGIEADLAPFLITRYIGMRSFAKAFGIFQTVYLVSSAAGPLIIGLAYDSLGSYDKVLPMVMSVLIVGAVLIVFLGKYPYPAVRGFDDAVVHNEFIEDKPETSPSAEPQVLTRK